jgi:predicted amino acid dehydrogenase
MAKIKYIIDHKGYGNIFDLTNTRTGEHTQITRDQAKDYISAADVGHTYFTFRAYVQVRSVSQVEIISGTKDALASLSIR